METACRCCDACSHPRPSHETASEPLKAGIGSTIEQHTLTLLKQQFDALTTTLEQSRAENSAAREEKRPCHQYCSSDTAHAAADNDGAGSNLEFRRVDQTWDASINDFRIADTVPFIEPESARYAFIIRRKFDWEQKLVSTVVDIKSRVLRDDLREIMKDAKAACLMDEEPSIEPDMLFLYEDDLQAFREQLRQETLTPSSRCTVCRIAHLQLLDDYLAADYLETRMRLRWMRAQGIITFDLAWALFKPNTLVLSKTYGTKDIYRCFRVTLASRESSFVRGSWYAVDGQFLGHDGTMFGLGEVSIDVGSFKGQRRISDLAVYPLACDPNPDRTRAHLVDRGRRFVQMPRMAYQYLSGLGFEKAKDHVRRVNVESRVMVDAVTFRRWHPDYPLPLIRNGDKADCRGVTISRVVEPAEEPVAIQSEHALDRPKQESGDVEYRLTTDEENLLISSPVVLGFAFSEKRWLELSLDGMRPIEWSTSAFDQLVLPNAHKQIVRSIVSSYQSHESRGIGDIVENKGRGLVFVLHGPPGVGKTLTAETIAETLRCPLYAISAGELGTQPEVLERHLQRTMELVHAWGAVLVLDEADVFLERREVHDVHRNALVSIFLRLLEYFQGILVLTTNRINTFDEAFHSRIHLPLCYQALDRNARKRIWKQSIEDVQRKMRDPSEGFADVALDELARHKLNGRQIRNTVRMAQYLSFDEHKCFAPAAIQRVLVVQEEFERDLKGGENFQDAMRAYA